MQAGSSVSKTPARLTLAAKENCFVLSVGNQDTVKECFSDKFSTRRDGGERMGTPNRRKRVSQAALMMKLLVETPIVKKTCN
jgi:hypothetical protein